MQSITHVLQSQSISTELKCYFLGPSRVFCSEEKVVDGYEQINVAASLAPKDWLGPSTLLG